MSITIPDEIIKRAEVKEKDIRLEIALLLFEKELFTLGQASEFAQLSQFAFMQELGKRDIAIHYDVEVRWFNLSGQRVHKVIKNYFWLL